MRVHRGARRTFAIVATALFLVAVAGPAGAPASKPARAPAAGPGRVLFVAPSGSDDDLPARGRIGTPFATLPYAFARAAPGDRIVLRGGVYRFARTGRGWRLAQRGGAAGRPIVIENHADEHPVLDGSDIAAGDDDGFVLQLKGVRWVVLKGFEIRHGAGSGLVLHDSSDNIIERLDVHHNGRLSRWAGTGISIYGASSRNLVSNNDSHHNRDRAGDNADGFQISPTAEGNIVQYNRAWANSDDGFDFFNVQNGTRSGSIVIRGNWSWGNGYDADGRVIGDGNGFKLGGQRPRTPTESGGLVVSDNLAWGNAQTGFDENEATRPSVIVNNTAYNNAAYNFGFSKPGNEIRGNVSFGHGRVADGGSGADNSWNRADELRASDFLSLDEAAARAPRRADGSLPASGFLCLIRGAGATLQNAGLGAERRCRPP